MVTIHNMYSSAQDYAKEDKYYSIEAGKDVDIYNMQFLSQVTGISAEKINELGKENVLSAIIQTGINNQSKMIGKDLTFSAPKSVSAIWALTKNDVLKQHIENAQKEAVKDALSFAEKELVVTRITQANQTETVKGEGMSAALFQHYTSRAQDPQLHTHAIVFNATQREDGKIRAIDWDTFGRAENLHTLDYVYKHSLATKLQEIGLKIEWDKNGKNFEIAGFSKEVLEKLSEREQDILKYAEEKGLDMSKSSDRKESILATREEKKVISKEELIQKTEEKLEKAGLLYDARQAVNMQEERYTHVTELKEQNVSEKEIRQDLRMMDGAKFQQVDTNLDERRKEAVVEAARTALSLQTGVFTKSDLVNKTVSWLHAQEARDANYAYLNISLKDIEKQIDSMIKDNLIEQVSENKGQAVYASKEFLQAEQKIMEAATKEKEAFMSKEQFDKLFSEYLYVFEKEKGFKPSQEQQEAVRTIFTSNKQFIAIQGRAGTGKSAGILAASKGFADYVNAKIDKAEKEIREELKNSNVGNIEEKLQEKLKEMGLPAQKFDAFFGVAPTGQAAKVLENDTGMKSMTIHSALNSFEKFGDLSKDGKTPRTNGIDPTIDRHEWNTNGLKQESRGMIFMDEAGMADARMMANMINAAIASDRRMIFVGDTAQFQSVGAGRAFDLFQKQKGAEVAYTENIIRQKDPFLRERAMEIARGDILSAWEKMEKSGKYIHEVNTKEEAFQKATEKFLENYEKTKNTFILVGTNKEKDVLNSIIRDKLIEKGKIDNTNKLTVEVITKDDTQRIEAKGQVLTRGTQQRETKEFAVGDRIIFLKNDNLLQKKPETHVKTYITKTKNGIKATQYKTTYEKTERIKITNGTIGTIKAVDTENNTLTVKFENGKTVTFNPNQYRNFDHAYAITGHKSQGATMDRVISVLDGNKSVHNANSVYVHVTRTKEEYTAFVVNKDKLEEKISEWQKNASATEMKKEWEEKRTEKELENLQKDNPKEETKDIEKEAGMEKEKTLEKTELAEKAEKLEQEAKNMSQGNHEYAQAQEQQTVKEMEKEFERDVVYDAGSLQIENGEIEMSRSR